ncbi:MAG: Lrp/AsnC ligand binding domain-containing protein [Chloroflexota bacterium]
MAEVVTRAFILVETQVGRAQQVAHALRILQGVRSADVITGTFDVIALIEAPDMGVMADLVTGRVQGIRGVLRTITCVAAG